MGPLRSDEGESVAFRNEKCVSSRIALAAVFAVIAAAGVLTVFADTAEAQVPNPNRHVYDKNIYYFQPPSDGSGLIVTWGSEPIGNFGIHAGAMVDYAHRPMEYTDPQDKVKTVIYNQTAVNGMFGVGLWHAFNVSGAFVQVPSRSFNSRYQDIYEWKEAVTGDARVAGKYMLFNRREDGMGIAFVGEVGLPTGDEENFVSDEQMTFLPRLVIDWGNEWYTLALNGGYKVYTEEIDGGLFNIPTGNEFLGSAGVTFRMFRVLELVGDYQMRMYEGESDMSKAYMEAFGAVRTTFFVNNPLRFTFGASAGLTDGVGTPISRFYGGVSFFFREIGKPR